MDFLDPNKKRSNIIKLYLGYVLMAIAIGMGATVLLFAIFGYGYNDGKLVQNGLVFISSQPDASDVYIEGITKDFKDNDKTNTKFTLNEGRYKATLIKDKYRSWQREFSIGGGSVLRMLYPFLFPENLETSNRETYASQPGFATITPDRQNIVVQRPDDFNTFDIFNANNLTNAKTSIAMPAGVLTAATQSQSLVVVEWSNDNQNVLLQHVYDDKTEFVLFNIASPEKSININTKINQNPYTIQLQDKKVDRIFVQATRDGLLELVDLRDNSITPFVGKTLAFKSHGDDTLVYVTPDAESPDMLSVRIRRNDKDYELRKLAYNPEANYLVDVARFDNSWYFTVGSSSDDRVYVYKDPVEVLENENSNKSLFARTMKIDNPESLSFSANTRFIAAQSGKNFAIYDADEDRQYRYEIQENIDTSRPAKWMDGHRLITSVDGNVFVFDFDGINSQTLMPIIGMTNTMFDRDYTIAYTLAGTETGVSLTQTPLRVEN